MAGPSALEKLRQVQEKGYYVKPAKNAGMQVPPSSPANSVLATQDDLSGSPALSRLLDVQRGINAQRLADSDIRDPLSPSYQPPAGNALRRSMFPDYYESIRRDDPINWQEEALLQDKEEFASSWMREYVLPTTADYFTGKMASKVLPMIGRALPMTKRLMNQGEGLVIPTVRTLGQEMVEGAAGELAGEAVRSVTTDEEADYWGALADGATFGAAIGGLRGAYDLVLGPSTKGSLRNALGKRADDLRQEGPLFDSAFDLKIGAQPGGSKVADRQKLMKTIREGFLGKWVLPDGKPVFDREMWRTTGDVTGSLRTQAERIFEFDRLTGEAINERIKAISEKFPLTKDVSDNVYRQTASHVGTDLGKVLAEVDQAIGSAVDGINIVAAEGLEGKTKRYVQNILSLDTGGVMGWEGLNSRRQQIDNLIRASLASTGNIPDNNTEILVRARGKIQEMLLDADRAFREGAPLGSDVGEPLEDLFTKQAALIEFNQVPVAGALSDVADVGPRELDIAGKGAGGISPSRFGSLAFSMVPLLRMMEVPEKANMLQKLALPIQGKSTMDSFLQGLDKFFAPSLREEIGSGIPASSDTPASFMPFAGSTRTAEMKVGRIGQSDAGMAVFDSLMTGEQQHYLREPELADTASRQPLLAPSGDVRIGRSRATPVIPRNIAEINDQGVAMVLSQAFPAETAGSLLLQWHKVSARGDKREKAVFLGNLISAVPDLPFQPGPITGLPSEFDLGDGRFILASSSDRARWKREIENSGLDEAEKAHRINALNKEGVVAPMDVSLSVPKDRTKSAEFKTREAAAHAMSFPFSSVPFMYPGTARERRIFPWLRERRKPE